MSDDNDNHVHQPQGKRNTWYKNRELSTCQVKNKDVIYLGIVGVHVLLTLDEEREVIQLAVNVRNVLTLSVVIACTRD